MAGVYFDSSVFTSIFKPEKERARLVRDLLKELKRNNVKIHTSIISVQECSVPAFRRGNLAKDYHAKINELSSVHGITKTTAMTAAKLEAGIVDNAKEDQYKRRRKWDCFHVATAMELACTVLYTWDKEMLGRGQQLGISGIEFLEPQPSNKELPFEEGNQPKLALAAGANGKDQKVQSKAQPETS